MIIFLLSEPQVRAVWVTVCRVRTDIPPLCKTLNKVKTDGGFLKFAVCPLRFSEAYLADGSLRFLADELLRSWLQPSHIAKKLAEKGTQMSKLKEEAFSWTVPSFCQVPKICTNTREIQGASVRWGWKIKSGCPFPMVYLSKNFLYIFLLLDYAHVLTAIKKSMPSS